MDIAIVAIGYNRPDSIKRLLSSLSKADYLGDEVTLYISLDKGDRQSELIKIAEEFNWPFGKKIVRAFPERQGLKRHVLQCGDLVINHDAIVALEDDIVVSPNFYNYVTQAVAFYGTDERVSGISLYKFNFQHYTGRAFAPVYNGFDCFFMRVAQSWGQCWTKNQWLSFREWLKDNDLKLTFNPCVPEHVVIWNDEGSWLKYYMYYTSSEKKYFVYPYFALSSCYSDAGAHTGDDIIKNQTELCRGNAKYRFPRVEEGIVYDAFFEREFSTPPDCIPEGKSYAVDLYAMKKNLSDYDLAITTQLLDYKIIRTFGYVSRPLEMNIVDDIEGEGIFLYDMRAPEKHKYSRTDKFIHSMTPYVYDIKYEYGPRRSLWLAIALMLKIMRGKRKK